MNIKANQTPPDLNSVRELLDCVNKALLVLQFLSDTSGKLVATSVFDVLDRFLPDFQHRRSLLEKLEEVLLWLDLFQQVDGGINVRTEVYAVTGQQYMRGRVEDDKQGLPIDDEMVQSCTAALSVLREHTETQVQAYGYLSQGALVSAVEQLVALEDAAYIIPYIKRLQLYQLDVYDGETICFVDRSQATVTIAMLEISNPLVDWPTLETLRNIFRQASVPSEDQSVDEIVKALIEIVEKCEAKLKRRDNQLRKLREEKKGLAKEATDLEERIEKLEAVLIVLDRRLPDGRVRQLLRHHGITFSVWEEGKK